MRTCLAFCLGSALLFGCQLIPTRAVDCQSIGACEPVVPPPGLTPFVLGQPNPTTNNRLLFGMFAPADAISTPGHLFVADSANHRVLIWNSFPPNVGQPPDLVIGQNDL